MDESTRIRKLQRSISSTVAIYFAAQCIIFAAFAWRAGFLGEYGLKFLLVSAAFHSLLWVLLRLFREDFRIETTGEPLSAMNLANQITLVRISTLPTLMYLVIAARTYRIRIPLLLLVVFIFITDFLDGYVSRKGNEVTKLGRMMDSASDYCLLIVLTVVFRYYQIIPIWFLTLVLFRLGIQIALMGVLIFVRKRIEPKGTKMGKVAIASLMVGYSVEVLGIIMGGLPPALKNFVEWVVGAILLASIGDKIWSFAVSLRHPELERRIPDGNDQERARTGARTDKES